MNDPRGQIETSSEAVEGTISFSLGESFEFGAELAESKKRGRRTIVSLSVKFSMEHITKIYTIILDFLQYRQGDAK